MSKGKVSKNATASQKTTISVDLSRPRSCGECGTSITRSVDLHPVVVFGTNANGGAKRRREFRCPEHKVSVAAGKK